MSPARCLTSQAPPRTSRSPTCCPASTRPPRTGRWCLPTAIWPGSCPRPTSAAPWTGSAAPPGRSHRPGTELLARSVDPDARGGDAQGRRVLRAQLLGGHAEARDALAVLGQVGAGLVRWGRPSGDTRGGLDRGYVATLAVAVQVQRHQGVGADVTPLPRVRLRVHQEPAVDPQEPARRRLRLPAG